MGGLNYKESALLRKRLGLSLKDWNGLINNPVPGKPKPDSNPELPKKVGSSIKRKKEKILHGRVIKISNPK